MELHLVLEILERSPAVLFSLLGGLSQEWVEASEGEGTWTPREVVGHLIHCEKVDWVPRMKIILEEGEGRPFDPVDPEGFRGDIEGRAVGQLLQDFQALRVENLKYLLSLKLGEEDLAKTGRHGELGRVTLAQLLATWASHDLAHIVQICRVMAERHREAVGPWTKYFRFYQE